MRPPRTTDQIQSELRNLTEALEAAGIYVAVEVRDGALILSGEVDSTEMRDAALDLAGIVAEHSDLEVEDAIEILDIDIEAASGPESEYHIDTPVADTSVVSDVGTTWGDLAAEEAIPFFPPTDPVLGARLVTPEDPEVIGGFQPTSMDYDAEETANQPHRGDDQITEDVRRELREDSLTTDLEIQVRTRNGIVYLTGEVPTMDDAESAEEVANRAAGVREVREDLTIRDLMTDRNR